MERNPGEPLPIDAVHGHGASRYVDAGIDQQIERGVSRHAQTRVDADSGERDDPVAARV